MRNVVTNIVLIVIISTMVPSVSWQGHLGGAIGGALVAVPLNFNHFGRGWQKFAGLLGTVAVPTIGLALAMHYTEQLLTEPQMVLRDLSPAFRIAEETAAQVFNEQVVPILANAGNDIDDARLGQARRSIQVAQQALRDALDRFAAAGPYQNPKVDRTVQNARAYLAAWDGFYTVLDKMIQTPRPWPDDQIRALLQQENAIAQSQKALASSTLLPAVWRLADKIRKP